MRTTLVLLGLVGCTLADQPILQPTSSSDLVHLQKTNPLERFESHEADRPADSDSVSAPRQSIISGSTIIHDGENWTLVPQGAVVFLPEALKSRTTTSPSGRLMSWLNFLGKNRAWITTTEVTIDQAAGNHPLPPERVTFWATQDKMIIAVHQQGPISVQPSPSTQTPQK